MLQIMVLYIGFFRMFSEKFSENDGGVKGHLQFSRKIIPFVTLTRPIAEIIIFCYFLLRIGTPTHFESYLTHLFFVILNPAILPRI